MLCFRKVIPKLIVLTILTISYAQALLASELIYKPINPSFGGNPLNGSYLLGKAQSQNDHNGDSASSAYTDPLTRFSDSLQRNILNQIARQIADQAFGGGDLGDGGIYETNDFSIEIISSNPDAIIILIENRNTGEITEIEVPVFN